MKLHTIIDAGTGKEILKNVTVGQFDRWYDNHCHYRAVRRIEEVHPAIREAYGAASDIEKKCYLVQDND